MGIIAVEASASAKRPANRRVYSLLSQREKILLLVPLAIALRSISGYSDLRSRWLLWTAEFLSTFVLSMRHLCVLFEQD